MIVKLTKEKRCILGQEKSNDIIEWVNQPRSDIPAITYVDYSARIQSVNSEMNPEYYNIIKSFKEITGYGVIVNTSFNVRGEPIVCTPHEAVNCLMNTEIDVLVMEDFIVTKNNKYIRPSKDLIKSNTNKETIYPSSLIKKIDQLFEMHMKNINKKITSKKVGGFNRENTKSCWIKYHSDTLYYLWKPENIDNVDYKVEEFLSNWLRINTNDKELFIPLLRDLINLSSKPDNEDDAPPLLLDEDVYTMF